MQKYFATFPQIDKLMTDLVKKALKNKYAYSPLDGRRIYLGAVDWDNGGAASHAKNKARNLPFQGAGASITKQALLQIYNRILSENLDAMIVNVVHDEILITCHKDIADYVKQITETEMISAFNKYCPAIKMSVVAEVGTHWIH